MAAGQKPQVFPQLLSPNESELLQFNGLSEEKGYCRLPTIYEEKARSTAPPMVVLRLSLIEHILFHVRTVLPHLYQKKTMVSKLETDQILIILEGYDSVLLLTTRDGSALHRSK